MKNIIIILILLFSNFVFSQSYYGKNDLGKIEFINDSTCLVSFLGFPYCDIVDTCTYIKNNDTILLSTKLKQQCNIEYHYDESTIGKGYPVLLKTYIKYSNGYKLGEEVWNLIYDTLNKRIIWNNSLNEDKLIVIRIGPYYDVRKFIKRQEGTNYGGIMPIIINLNFGPSYNYLYFDNFPLLLKGNKLVPIDKEKNETCWIENGFYFPIMKRSKKVKRYRTISYWSKELRG